MLQVGPLVRPVVVVNIRSRTVLVLEKVKTRSWRPALVPEAEVGMIVVMRTALKPAKLEERV